MARIPLLTALARSVRPLPRPYFAAGSLKIIYDLALYHNFRSLKPPEEV